MHVAVGIYFVKRLTNLSLLNLLLRQLKKPTIGGASIHSV